MITLSADELGHTVPFKLRESWLVSRRQIKGVLHNFLGTFASRYSDFHGYWVFGFLVQDLERISIDLIDKNPDTANDIPSGFVRRLAIQKFTEQIRKAGLPSSYFQKAHLSIAKSSTPEVGWVNGRSCSGFEVMLVAHAITDLGKSYKSELAMFVAPHDPKVEMRRKT